MRALEKFSLIQNITQKYIFQKAVKLSNKQAAEAGGFATGTGTHGPHGTQGEMGTQS